jgi:RNA polymerase sigma factor (TIGR02999 family)
MAGVTSEPPPAAGADVTGLNKVFDSLYRELHFMAHQQLRRNGSGGLNTTVLVHELYLRLAKADEVPVSDPRHFLAYACNAMRFVIVDIIRAQNSEKRGAGVAPLTLDARLANSISTSADEIVRVHEALLELASIDALLVQVVEMRYFAGLTEAEIAESMQMSTRTVRRHWQKAVIYLRANLP